MPGARGLSRGLREETVLFSRRGIYYNGLLIIRCCGGRGSAVSCLTTAAVPVKSGRVAAREKERVLEKAIRRAKRIGRYTGAGALVAAFFVGCGFIADKDRIKVAKIGDRYITRGDLAKLIWEMPDDERPNIRNKGDLLRVLDGYINAQLQARVVEEVERELAAQGKELVSRDMAKQLYFQQHAEDRYGQIYRCPNAEAIGMSDLQLEMLKEEIDLGIDRVYDKLRGDAAITYLAFKAYAKGELPIAEEEFQQEYNLRKDKLKRLEWMRFRAIRFPERMPGSAAEAAHVRKRLDAGESFDVLAEEYGEKNPEFVLTSEIENNPGLIKFTGFWSAASGCKKGDIIGPVYLPEYQIMAEGGAGPATVKNMPAAYLVLEVLEHTPEATLSLEEAQGEMPRVLIAPILVAKTMQQLRQDNGVEIYEDKLPDPALLGEGAAKPAGAL